jgi:nucleoside phosphorylase
MHAVRKLIVVGVSGALAPSLPPGGILVGREVVDGQTSGEVPSPDRSWVERILEDHGGVAATLIASPVILATPEAKAEAYASFPPGANAAVDLETASFAREAAARGIPYVAVRAVSDAASESLPLDFNLLRDAHGGVDRLRVAAAAALRPSAIVPLWRLRGRMALCSRGLAGFVRGILAGERA